MPSVPDQLEKLAALLREGLITREEFDEQKRKLLTDPGSGSSSPGSDQTMLTEVGAYRLLGLIGEGGMGAVYRGRHRSETMAERQSGDVAVKVMHAQYARNPDYRDRFGREAALGMKLDHPGIVKVHDLVVDGGNLALVMDFVDGRPLSDSIGEAVGPIPWDRAWPLFQKLLAAVGYAHHLGVVHRDIKPENILVPPDGEPHVIDFGIAKGLDSSGTRTGTGMGTVEYMAPEQYADAKAVDRRADIYSLGMILYEMLAGRLPWNADVPQFRILEQKANRQLMSPSAFCSDIPPEIVAALSPALSGTPEARPSTATSFADALVDASADAARRLRDEERQRQAEVEQQRRAIRVCQQRAERERQRDLMSPRQRRGGEGGRRKNGASRPRPGKIVLLILAALLIITSAVLWSARQADRTRERTSTGSTDDKTGESSRSATAEPEKPAENENEDVDNGTGAATEWAVEPSALPDTGAPSEYPRIVTLPDLVPINLREAGVAPQDPSQMGTIAIYSSAPVAVWVGGHFIGHTPIHLLSLQVGEHEFEFTNHGMGWVAQRTVAISAGPNRDIRLSPVAD